MKTKADREEEGRVRKAMRKYAAALEVHKIKERRELAKMQRKAK